MSKKEHNHENGMLPLSEHREMPSVYDRTEKAGNGGINWRPIYRQRFHRGIGEGITGESVAQRMM